MRTSTMRGTLCAAAVAAAIGLAGSARANVLLYSFEPTDTGGATDGFTRTSPLFTVATTSAGATVGTGALALTAKSSYGGAYSTLAGPLAALDNPTVTAISADIFNPTTYTGNYADLGVTIFISNGTTGDYGENFTPSTSLFQNVDFAAGSETTVTIPLVATDPVSGLQVPFSTVLAEGYVPTEFQFTLSSDASAATPFAFNVDNVQAVTPASVPEPASMGLIAAGGLALGRRRRQRA